MTATDALKRVRAATPAEDAKPPVYARRLAVTIEEVIEMILAGRWQKALR